MAPSGLLALPLVLLVTAIFHGGAWAKGPSTSPSTVPGPSPTPPLAPGPGPSTDCMTILLDKLSPCLTYVQDGSNLTRPEKKCCRGLAAVVSGEPLCLCSLLSASADYGLNRSRALMLPAVCRVKTPPLTLCSGAPAPSPGPSTSGAAPGGSTAAGAGGTAAAPPSGNGVDPTFGSSALVLLAALGLAIAALGIF